MNAVRIDAPAKVNLRLRILAREASGYHSLETIFCALDLCDTLRLERSEATTLVAEGGVDMGPPERNLALRAVERFQAETGHGGVRVTLRKRIPSAAGLGGGSSDAAAALRAVNHLFGEPLSDAELLQLGVELGSDVPFFLAGSPLALGWGRGERLLALPPLPAAEVLVAHPGQPMSTADAFARIAAMRQGYSPQARRFHLAELSSWQAIETLATNDFEPVAAQVLPQIADALALLQRSGATITLLAGSGASVFGVFASGGEIASAEAQLRAGGFATWRARTLERLPDPG